MTHRTWLRKVIHARTGEAQAVDEVFQEVALAAVEQRSPLADPAKSAPWLHRLAVVHSARYRRRSGRQRNTLRRAMEQHHLGNGHAGDLLAWLVARERRERTREALNRLAGRDAEILVLKYHDILIEFDGEWLTTVGALNEQVQQIKDREVAVRLLRNGRDVIVEVAPQLRSEPVVTYSPGIELFMDSIDQQAAVPQLELLSRQWKPLYAFRNEAEGGEGVGVRDDTAPATPADQVRALRRQLAEMQQSLARLEAALRPQDAGDGEAEAESEE